MAEQSTQIAAPAGPRFGFSHRSLDLTVAGLAFGTLMSLMGVAAGQSQANLLVVVFGAMVGVFVLSIWIGPKMLSGLTIRRTIPEHGVVGQPMAILYHVENFKRWWPTISVNLAEIDGAGAFARPPRAYLLHVAPRGETTLPVEYMARRRGVYPFNRMRISSTFPFGFVKRATIQRIGDAALVYPAIGRVDPRVLQMCRPAESAGTRMRPKRGGTDEFYGVKEYRAGENPRWIYWRRSARTGTLVAREMSHVSPPSIMILVDTHLPQPTPEAQTDVERAIAMAASLASAALEEGLPVGLIAYSNEWLHMAPNRGKRYRRDILTALARLPQNPSHDQNELMAKASQYARSDTTVVLMTPSPRRLSIGEAARGGAVVLGAGASEAGRFFTFPETVNFARCMPVDQMIEQQKA